MSVLSNKAMLAKLSISSWNPMRVDAIVTKKTNSDYGANSDAGHYRKALISPKELEPIRQIENQARKYHNEQTLPWQDRGARLLPAKNHTNYSTGMRGFKLQFESAVATFLNVYPSLVRNAQSVLGSMFKLDEYPSQSDLESTFDFKIEIDVVPDAKDFRVDIADAEKARIQKEIEDREVERQQAAMEDVKTRVIEALQPIAQKLKDPKARVYDAYIDNLSAIVNLVPSLNITEDPKLNAMCLEIKNKLGDLSAKELRKDKEARKAASEDAAGIMEKYNLGMEMSSQRQAA